MLAFVMLVQDVAAATGTRPVDILITVLLTIVGAISGWTLRTVLRHQDEVTELKLRVWGKDGKNGQSGELREMRRSFRSIERYLSDLSYRVQRIEEKVGLPSGEHPRIKHADDDDPEDDRRGE